MTSYYFMGIVLQPHRAYNKLSFTWSDHLFTWGWSWKSSGRQDSQPNPSVARGWLRSANTPTEKESLFLTVYFKSSGLCPYGAGRILSKSGLYLPLASSLSPPKKRCSLTNYTGQLKLNQAFPALEQALTSSSILRSPNVELHLCLWNRTGCHTVPDIRWREKTSVACE